MHHQGRQALGMPAHPRLLQRVIRMIRSWHVLAGGAVCHSVMVNQNGQAVKDRMIPYVQKKTGGPEEPPAIFSNNFVGVSLWKQ
jgi:hypothetical protein